MYVHGHHDSVLRSHRWRTAENSAGYLLGHLEAGLSLLDVGCGPGTLTADLARRVAPGRVVGIDAAESVLDEARAAAVGLDNVEFAEGDVYSLDFGDDSFDVVHAHQVLQHLTDPVGALAEMARVSRGVVAVRDVDYATMTWWPASPDLDRWAEVYALVSRADGGEPDAARRLLSWAQAAGLFDVVATTSTWSYSTPPDREWWGGLWADRIVGSRIADRAVELGVATRHDLEEMSQAWRSWAAAPDGWFAMIHGEILVRAPMSTRG